MQASSCITHDATSTQRIQVARGCGNLNQVGAHESEMAGGFLFYFYFCLRKPQLTQQADNNLHGSCVLLLLFLFLCPLLFPTPFLSLLFLVAVAVL